MSGSLRDEVKRLADPDEMERAMYDHSGMREDLLPLAAIPASAVLRALLDATAPTPDEPPVSLRVPLNREPNPDGDGLNVGVEHVEVHVRIDPDCETLGKATWEYAYDHRLFPVITLREPNEQVLLHELLHIALVQVPADRLTALNDPHGHDIISRIEVALWETGWRRVGSVVTAPTPDEVGLVEGGLVEGAPVVVDAACLARWPECHPGEYDPRCCRFPKSCSAKTDAEGKP